MSNPQNHFTALCDSLRKEGGEHSGNTKVVAIAFDGDMSVTMESFGGKDPDIAWRDMLRIVVNRYLDVWAGDDFDRDCALASLDDDIAEFTDAYREEYGIDHRLTEAVPDLLMALAGLLGQIEALGIPDWAGAEGLSLDEARAAIAAATGKEAA